jgi:hypothetical protein
MDDVADLPEGWHHLLGEDKAGAEATNAILHLGCAQCRDVGDLVDFT